MIVLPDIDVGQPPLLTQHRTGDPDRVLLEAVEQGADDDEEQDGLVRGRHADLVQRGFKLAEFRLIGGRRNCLGHISAPLWTAVQPFSHIFTMHGDEKAFSLGVALNGWLFAQKTGSVH